MCPHRKYWQYFKIKFDCSMEQSNGEIAGTNARWRNFFKLNLLGWHWLIKLHRFQVYNSITHHLCIVCSPPQIKSPSITIYLPFTLFYLPHPTPFPSGNHHTVVCVHDSFFLCLIPSPFLKKKFKIAMSWACINVDEKKPTERGR